MDCRNLLVVAAMVAGMAACEDGAERPGRTESGEPVPVAGVVELAEQAVANIDLATETARPRTLTLSLGVGGRVELDSTRMARVAAPFDARVAKLLHAPGERVAAGAVVVVLESPEFPERPLSLVAPVAGVVARRGATVGQFVQKGEEILSIADPDALWLVADVKERDAGSVRVGMPLVFRLPALSGEAFEGRVARVATSMDADSRTLELLASIGSRGGRIKPGMYADVSLATGAVENAVAIPEAALQSDGDATIAFVRTAPRRFEKRTLRIGRLQDGRAEILEGIGVGDEVVIRGGFALKSELLKSELGEE